MNSDLAFYNQLIDVSKEKDDFMNVYNPRREHYEMIVIVRKDLKMSIGKTAAQVGHAVLTTYKQAIKSRQDIVNYWEGSGQAKIILGIETLEELITIKNKADSLSIPNSMIIDAGFNEVLPNSITCIGFGPGKVTEIALIKNQLHLL